MSVYLKKCTKEEAEFTLVSDMVIKPYSPIVQIDWEKVVGSDIPVRFWDEDEEEESFIGFLHAINSNCSYPFRAAKDYMWQKASLDTGKWVPNTTGQNIWPKGCIVEIINGLGGPYTPFSSEVGTWGRQNTPIESIIIASRFVKLAKGYTF